MKEMISKALKVTALGMTFLLVACGGVSSPTASGLTANFSSDESAGINNVTMEQISSSGDTVTVAIQFNNIDQQLMGATLDLTYTDTVTSVSSVNQGDIVSGSVSFIPTDDGNGHLLITNLDSTVSSSKSGILCTIVFKGITAGNSLIEVVSASSDIFNAAGDPIPGVTWSGGTVGVN